MGFLVDRLRRRLAETHGGGLEAVAAESLGRQADRRRRAGTLAGAANLGRTSAEAGLDVDEAEDWIRAKFGDDGEAAAQPLQPYTAACDGVDRTVSLRTWPRRRMALARRRPCSCLVLGLKIGRTAPVFVFDTAAWDRLGLLCGVSVRRFGRLRQVWCIGQVSSLLCSDQREDDSNSKARNGDGDGPSGSPEPATLPLRQLLDGIKERR
jgi:hypothetical protein